MPKIAHITERRSKPSLIPPLAEAAFTLSLAILRDVHVPLKQTLALRKLKETMALCHGKNAGE